VAQEVAQEMGMGKDYGLKWWQVFYTERHVRDAPGKGRRVDKLDEMEQLQAVTGAVIEQPGAKKVNTWAELTRRVNAKEKFEPKVSIYKVKSAATALGYVFKSTKRQPRLSAVGKQRRLHFALATKAWTKKDWQLVNFTDSKVFVSDAPNSLSSTARPLPPTAQVLPQGCGSAAPAPRRQLSRISE
jgi:hypothetical protein